MIMLSRNTPVAYTVGAAGFIGSHLCDKLLDHGIQVIGADDFSDGKRENLSHSAKDKHFHLINDPGEFNLDLPRLDYAFFALDPSTDKETYIRYFKNFLEICKKYKPKIVLISSVDLYDRHKSNRLSALESAEVKLAEFSLENNINARVVRLSSVFGPRMDFNSQEPVSRLILAACVDRLQDEATPLDFTSRSLYVMDAVDLLIKAVMHGSTAQKIYDGIRMHPVKLTEIKQILLDPLWHERRGFTPTELPPWPTPNIHKTMKELSWKNSTPIISALRETVAFFKENPILIKQPQNQLDEKKGNTERPEEKKEDWGEKWRNLQENSNPEVVDGKQNEVQVKTQKKVLKGYPVGKAFKKYTFIWVAIFVIMLAYFYPVASIAADFFSFQSHINQSSEASQKGDFQAVSEHAGMAEKKLVSIRQVTGSLGFTKPLFTPIQKEVELSLSSAEELAFAVSSLGRGHTALTTGLKVVSGEIEGESGKFFETANFEFDQADRYLSLMSSRLSEENLFLSGFNLKKTLSVYVENLREDIKKGRTSSLFLAQAVPKEGKKRYLVILQDNSVIRPSGGVVVALAEVVFENGKLLEIKTQSIEEFENSLTEKGEMPQDYLSDFSSSAWTLRDFGLSADFPTNARLAQLFWRRAGFISTSGVIALDLSAVSVMRDGQEKVSGNEKDLDKLLKESVNRVFFLSGQSLMKTGKALDTAAAQKHIMVYMSEPLFFSFLTTEGFSGSFPNIEKDKVGERLGFLSLSEANVTGRSSGFITRSIKLQTSIDPAGGISNNLSVLYGKPDASFKNRLKIYLQAGSKLSKAMWGGKDILKEVRSFSDYGRAGYSMLLDFKAGEEKELLLEYRDVKTLTWEANKAKFKLQVVKQPGTLSDKIDFKLDFPSSWRVEDSEISTGEQIFATNLSGDRTFEAILKK